MPETLGNVLMKPSLDSISSITKYREITFGLIVHYISIYICVA